MGWKHRSELPLPQAAPRGLLLAARAQGTPRKSKGSLERLKENEVCGNRLCTVCRLDPVTVTGQVNKGTEFRFYG